MSAIDEIADAIVAARDSGAHLRIATVTAVQADGARVQLDLSATAWVPVDRDVAPKTQDRVYVLQQGPVLLVVGKIGATPIDSGGVPVGAITQYAGTSSAMPAGWLLSEGQAVSRTDFALLFQRLGTTYGAGDGSTTFNLPDLRARVPLGVGGGRSRGAVGGAERVTLSEGQMPGHDHGSAGSHIHRVYGAGGVQETQSGFGATSAEEVHSDTSSTGAHTHGWRGNNESHENMQPFQVMYYIIRVV